ncbi:MAG: hypothetical protein RL518_1310 [Pseudomonadota bacterium]|jgi:hypothetical protein
MRSSLLRFGCVSAITLATLTACEYEFKDEPITQRREEASDSEADAGEEAAAAQEQKRGDAPKPLGTLPPGKPYQGSTTLPTGAKRIDMLNLAATNQASLAMNAPTEPIENLFDGADDSLVRTPEINPLDTTITFTSPTKIKALRVRSTYSDFAIAVQVDGGERLILDPIPDGDWATIIWPTPVTAKKILVQTLRKNRDNFVHVNEIELYQ